MRERPIIFGTWAIPKLLDGSKTMTRRPLKKQPIDVIPMKVPGQWIALMQRNPNKGQVFRCRWGQIGDRLWVRETWAMLPLTTAPRKPIYRADCPDWHAGYTIVNGRMFKGWKPSIHMPRWAARIVDDITDVWVERLLDISEEDAIKEGFQSIQEFLDYWDALYSKKPEYQTSANPWVSAISFTKR